MKKTKRYTRSSNDSGGSGGSSKSRTRKKKKKGGSPSMVNENLVPAISDPSVLVHVAPDLHFPLEHVVDDITLQKIHDWGKSIEVASPENSKCKDDNTMNVTPLSVHKLLDYAPPKAPGDSIEVHTPIDSQSAHLISTTCAGTSENSGNISEKKGNHGSINKPTSSGLLPRSIGKTRIFGRGISVGGTLLEGILGPRPGRFTGLLSKAGQEGIHGSSFNSGPCGTSQIVGTEGSNCSKKPSNSHSFMGAGVEEPSDLNGLPACAGVQEPLTSNIQPSLSPPKNAYHPLPSLTSSLNEIQHRNPNIPFSFNSTSINGNGKILPPHTSSTSSIPFRFHIGSSTTPLTTPPTPEIPTSFPTLPNGTRILSSDASPSSTPSNPIPQHTLPNRPDVLLPSDDFISHDPLPSSKPSKGAMPPPRHNGPNSQKKTYASVFAGSRLEAKGLQLQFIDQQGEDVELESTDEVPFIETWGYCLIGCFTGPFPGREALNSIVKGWGVKCRIIPYGKGWTIFKFMTEEERTNVLNGGPYMTFGKTMMLKPIDKGVLLTDDLFMDIPIWVTFHEIPLSVWSASGLSKIASRVGKPLYTDQFTKERSKMNYARVLVEVDVSKKPVTEFGVKLPDNRRYIQKVQYENYPDFCYHCTSFGHNHLKCKILLQNNSSQEARNSDLPLAPTCKGADSSSPGHPLVAGHLSPPLSDPPPPQLPEGCSILKDAGNVVQSAPHIPGSVGEALNLIIPPAGGLSGSLNLRVPLDDLTVQLPDIAFTHQKRIEMNTMESENSTPFNPHTTPDGSPRGNSIVIPNPTTSCIILEHGEHTNFESQALAPKDKNEGWTEVTTRRTTSLARKAKRGGTPKPSMVS